MRLCCSESAENSANQWIGCWQERSRNNSYLDQGPLCTGGAPDSYALEGHQLEERASLAAFMNVDPGLDPLRADARFEELLARMGLSHR